MTQPNVTEFNKPSHLRIVIKGIHVHNKTKFIKCKGVAKYKHEPFAVQSIREISLDREVLC